jgi:hypothetical protein
MANLKPALLSQVTLTSSNNHLHYTCDGAAKSCTVTAGAYDDMQAVIVALHTAMEAEAGVGATITITTSTTGYITIAYSGAGTFQLNHDVAGSNMGQLLGFDDSTANTAAITYTGNWPHMHGYYHPYVIESDSDERTWRGDDPAPVITMSGLVRRVTNANNLQRRQLRLGYIPRAKLQKSWDGLSAGNGGETTYLEWWNLASAGTPFEYYESSDAMTASEGTYYLIEPVNSGLDVARYAANVPYYGPVTLTMQKGA